jgi:hypothetical protein
MKAHEQVRRGQVITTYGPGALIDLRSVPKPPRRNLSGTHVDSDAGGLAVSYCFPARFSVNRMVEPRGIEPLTFALRTRRSPS